MEDKRNYTSKEVAEMIDAAFDAAYGLGVNIALQSIELGYQPKKINSQYNMEKYFAGVPENVRAMSESDTILDDGVKTVSSIDDIRQVRESLRQPPLLERLLKKIKSFVKTREQTEETTLDVLSSNYDL